MVDLVTVAGVPLPEPSTYDAQIATIVDSARNTAGYVIGAVIRNDIAKVSLSWRYLTVAQWASILGIFTESFYNDVTFFNPSTGAYDTRKMYVSDRTQAMWRRDPETGDVLGWTGCKLSLVEV